MRSGVAGQMSSLDWGLGFMFYGSGSNDQSGLGLRIEGLEFSVCGLGFPLAAGSGAVRIFVLVHSQYSQILSPFVN